MLRLSPAECTCFRIRSAARRVTAIYTRHLAPTGLKISQFSLLGFIAADGPVSIGRLSELLATDRTTLTRNLRPLLNDGRHHLAKARFYVVFAFFGNHFLVSISDDGSKPLDLSARRF